MTIWIPPRKGLKAKALAQQNPDLNVSQVARLAGMDRGAAKKALAKATVGMDRRSSRS